MTRRADDSPKRDDVGPGRPPKEHQFQPGESGNRKGRPRKKPPQKLEIDLAALAVKVGCRMVPVIEGGKERKITFAEFNMIQLARKAASGHAASMRAYHELLKEGIARSPQANDGIDHGAELRARIEAVAQRLREEREERLHNSEHQAKPKPDDTPREE